MNDATASAPVSIDTVQAFSGAGYPEPFSSRMGMGEWRDLGDHFGLTQYGVSHETLKPGAQSALRHWHTLSDEFVLILSGELVLRTDEGERLMTPGMCAGFKAGVRNGHHLVNRSSAEARFIVIGSRIAGDRTNYPDDDLDSAITAEGKVWLHKDGTPY